MTGIFVIPMITASGPPSEEDGVLLPLEIWCSGLAESSSLLITEEGPRRKKQDLLLHDNSSSRNTLANNGITSSRPN